jgi:hypothetical protein
MDALSSAALSTVARSAASNPVVLQDRARAAAVLDAGYGWLDTYEALQPVLFWGSVFGAIASGYALAKRRKVPEAVTLYTASELACLATAWMTRPAWLRPAPSPAEAAAAASSSPAVAQLIGWMDKRVVDNSASRPGWERLAWSRLGHDAGITDPSITALLLTNAR